jgi:hypothetical protein
MKSKAMPKMSRKMATTDEIAAMASRGEDVSSYFTNKFTSVRPARFNISRQAVIKTLLGRALSEEREQKRRPKKAG